MHQQRCRSFHPGDAFLHRVLHFLEGAHFNLAHALARDAELGGDLFKRDWVLGEPARLENALFAIVEHEKRRGERPAACGRLEEAVVQSTEIGAVNSWLRNQPAQVISAAVASLREALAPYADGMSVRLRGAMWLISSAPA